jgi:hypothetical protein
LRPTRDWLKWQPSVGEGNEAAPSHDRVAPPNCIDNSDLFPVSETRTEEAIQDAARSVCNQLGLRIIRIRNKFALGIWKELDCPELRSAIQVLALPPMKVLYLGDPNPNIPHECKQHIPECLKRNLTTWRVAPEDSGANWNEWKASLLNRATRSGR